MSFKSIMPKDALEYYRSPGQNQIDTMILEGVPVPNGKIKILDTPVFAQLTFSLKVLPDADIMMPFDPPAITRPAIDIWRRKSDFNEFLFYCTRVNDLIYDISYDSKTVNGLIVLEMYGIDDINILKDFVEERNGKLITDLFRESRDRYPESLCEFEKFFDIKAGYHNIRYLGCE